MKTNNQDNYRLVRACFIAFCENHEPPLTPFINAVVWEHGGFSCSARDDSVYGVDPDCDEDNPYGVYDVADEYEAMKQFRAVDACCPLCGTAAYCSSCGRNCQIDFEEV